MRERLTDMQLKELKSRDGKPIDVYDAVLENGFGVRVGARRKTFFLLYRSPGTGIKRRHTIGHYPEMSLKKARDEAKKIVANEQDPAGIRERERELKNFAGLAKIFLDTHTGQFRPNTDSEYRRIIEDELIPRFGQLPPSKISRIEVRSFLTEKAQKHPTMANRIRGVLHRVFNWANQEDIVTVNPVAGIPSRKETKRAHVLRHDEIRAIWKASEMESPVSQAFIRTLFLTGLRRSEVLGASWEHIDVESGWWRVPAVATKSQMRLDVPLTPKLREIFDALQRFGHGKKFVFASFHRDEDVPISGLSKIKARIDKRSKVTGWRFHDVRRTVITTLGDMGASDEIKRALLGHAISGALAHYDHSSMALQKREWLERWQTSLAKIVETEAGEVVEFGA